MNIEQIEHNTNENRELDRWAAEYILEWRNLGQWDHIDKETGEWLVDDDDWVGVPPDNQAKKFVEIDGYKMACVEFIPPFSERIECAMELADYLISKGFAIEIISIIPLGPLKNKWKATFTDMNAVDFCIANGIGYVNEPKEKYEWFSFGITLPLAIVKAALITILSQKKNSV